MGFLNYSKGVLSKAKKKAAKLESYRKKQLTKYKRAETIKLRKQVNSLQADLKRQKLKEKARRLRWQSYKGGV